MTKELTAVERILSKLPTSRDEVARFVLAEKFLEAGANAATYMALSRLCASGYLRRVSAGIYATWPADYEKTLAWTDELAAVVALRSDSLVRTEGRVTASRLRFASGSNRHIYISNGGQAKVRWQGHEIEIKRVRPALFEAACTDAGQIVQALYWVGPAHLKQLNHLSHSGSTRPNCATMASLIEMLPLLPSWAATAVKALLQVWR